MVNYEVPILDNVFGALANSQRREIITMLMERPKSITELAVPLKMSLPAINKHIKVLERAKLINRKKIGRSNELILVPTSLTGAQSWIDFHRTYWNQQLDSLSLYVDRSGKD